MFFSLSTLALLAATAASMPFSPSATTAGKNGLEQNSHLRPNSTVAKRWTCNTSATLTTGESDNGGAGVTIKNADSQKRGYYIYHNNCDTMPYKYIWIDAGETKFVSFPAQFQGRITRGTDEYNLKSAQWLGTWFEIGYDASGIAYSDVSLIRGCDGAVSISALDGTGVSIGFTQSILDGAPTGAYATKSNGQKVLAASENLDGSINTAVRDWYISEVGITNAYVDDYHGDPVIRSSNGRFATTWEAGRP
ncbi:hypothetical protein BKA67DRAFT_674211 [Truncatella angustata]|uniref:Uncharacterized protein n=1 Tax=Truncatella angustata TaxID=152316 RepID=A0A9P9A2J5_9PEZI|nr:uncharacterized protein BKA67DRAFT_674211 [Truncatella angustata]KAH6658281.1 hypothetical protein BKA67DRAFT_674211 [Truncatella angustata]KAH8198575.1 hypothetical protein TruAng_007256 [Truncatella angustata]